jgi:hypothetical protein
MRRRLTGLGAVLALAVTGVAAAGPAGAGVRPASGGWSYQHVPRPAGAQDANPQAVTCPSGSDCIAVGDYVNSHSAGLPLAEHWTGRAWSLESVPADSGWLQVNLAGVSCATATRCMAVGSYATQSGPELVSHPVSAQMNGTSWTAHSTIPLPAGATTGTLAGVSCTTATDCTAVGSYAASEGIGPLAERWNGQAWARETFPNPAGSADTALTAISCPTASQCVAVGYYTALGAPGGKALAAGWNGTSWRLLNVPLPAAAVGGGALSAISCRSATDCTAGGSYSPKNTDDFSTLAEHWNGRAWAVQPTPNPGSTKVLADVFIAVSCGSAASCVAVGTEVENGSTAYPVAEAWNGQAWTVQQTAAPELRNEGLQGVACVSATTCTAVGSYSLKNVADLLPLAEHTRQA